MRGIWRAVASVFVLASLLVGCAGHLTLQAPAASAPEEERLRAYENLRPVDRSITRAAVQSSDPGGPSRSVVATNFIVLGNEQTVEHVEDLLPLVPPDSDMARDARKSVVFHRLSTGLIVLGVAATIATGVLVGLSIKDEDPRAEAIAVGGGAVSGLLIGTGIGARIHSGHRASRAFSAYDHALRRRLDLCDTNGALATCKHLPPVVP